MAGAKFWQALKFRAALLGTTPEELSRQQDESLAASEIGGPECLDSEELAALVDGAEPDSEQTAHLVTCPVCQNTLAILKDSIH